MPKEFHSPAGKLDPLAQKRSIIALAAKSMPNKREKGLPTRMSGNTCQALPPQALAETLPGWPPPWPALAADPVSATAGDNASASAAKAKAAALVFNQAEVLERMKGYDALVTMMIEAFLREFPAQIEALKKHLDAADTQSAIRSAHTMKSQAALVGGEALSTVAFELEASADLATIRRRLPELTARFAELTTPLQGYLAAGVSR